MSPDELPVLLDVPPAADAFAALPLLIPIPTAARLLGISRASAYRLASAGELPCRRLGGRAYIITAELRALVGAA
jgi:excisionase family DNA binding protein